MPVKEKRVGVEGLIEENPDVIFVVLTEWFYGKDKEVLDHIYGSEVLRNTNAAMNKRVYPLYLYYIYCPGVRAYDGIHFIGNSLYPDMED